jgi:hypothetical protein
VVVRRSAIAGRGVFATRAIARGERIIEYLGERISHAEAERRYDDTKMKVHHTFLFTVSSRTVIDARRGGNAARFINHSCDPNCEAVDERGRIFVEAKRAIAAGEELVYDYQYERDPDDGPEVEAMYPCRCGTAQCRGTILAPRKKSTRQRRGHAVHGSRTPDHAAAPRRRRGR